jgi:hypothetical protein
MSDETTTTTDETVDTSAATQETETTAAVTPSFGFKLEYDPEVFGVHVDLLNRTVPLSVITAPILAAIGKIPDVGQSLAAALVGLEANIEPEVLLSDGGVTLSIVKLS